MLALLCIAALGMDLRLPRQLPKSRREASGEPSAPDTVIRKKLANIMLGAIDLDLDSLGSIERLSGRGQGCRPGTNADLRDPNLKKADRATTSNTTYAS